MKAELNKEEKKQLRRETLEVPVPAVFRERGYLLLTLARNSGNILFVDTREGKYDSMSARVFADTYSHVPDLNPSYLALNLLGRTAEGFFRCSVRVQRRLIAMVTKEDLMKLSERAFGKEYSRIMGLPHPLTRISNNPEIREKYADLMLAKLAEQPAPQQAPASSDAPEAAATDPAPAPEQSAAEQQPTEQPTEQSAAPAPESSSSEAATPPTTTEGADMAKQGKKAKKKATGAAAKKQESARNVTYDKVAASVKNPYREGSKKAKAFEVFRAGGERSAILAKITKLGVTDSSAASWVNLFRKVK